MSSRVNAFELPRLASLYAEKAIAAASGGAKFSPSASLNSRIALYTGDITALRIPAIVNAANSSLLGGGGVDGAIHRAAGRGLLQECRTLNGCETGSAKMTGGYELPAEKVIHAVGPIYGMQSDKESERLLRGCYRTSLELAAKAGLKGVAFPAISTGVYGYPAKDAARAAFSEVRTFLEKDGGGKTIDLVVFVAFDQRTMRVYEEVAP